MLSLGAARSTVWVESWKQVGGVRDESGMERMLGADHEELCVLTKTFRTYLEGHGDLFFSS